MVHSGVQRLNGIAILVYDFFFFFFAQGKGGRIFMSAFFWSYKAKKGLNAHPSAAHQRWIVISTGCFFFFFSFFFFLEDVYLWSAILALSMSPAQVPFWEPRSKTKGVNVHPRGQRAGAESRASVRFSS
jgi:hypothetical protein